MRQYVRWRRGSVFFFTLVTHCRQPILTADLGRRCLRTAIAEIRQKHPFKMHAIVLLPDHLHAIWELPREDVNYSTRWRLIKKRFSQLWIAGTGSVEKPSPSRQRKGEAAVWQRRFYEHTCRDEEDFSRCLNYLHVNPLKHGLVEKVIDWKWSSFHRYVENGLYAADWGSADEWYGDEFASAE